jgi:hypothetical protein
MKRISSVYVAALFLIILAGPAAQSAGQTLGSLRVTINPPAAGAAGGQWHLDGSRGYASGETVQFQAGPHSVTLQEIPGWDRGQLRYDVTVVAGRTTELSVSYIKQTTIRVRIEPRDAAQAGVTWGVDQPQNWRSGDFTIVRPGAHNIHLNKVSPWRPLGPNPLPVNAAPQQDTVVDVRYERIARIGARVGNDRLQGSATWRINQGPWRRNGEWEDCERPGPHTLEFMDIPGWIKPPNETVNAAWGTDLTMDRAYREPQARGSLRVRLDPPDLPRAFWRIDNGPWNNPGQLVQDLAMGQHSLEYNDPGGGWIVPPRETIALDPARKDMEIARTYRRASLSVSVTIEPPAAAQAGARWRVVGRQDWRASGAVVSDLQAPAPAGGYEVEFAPVQDWETPARMRLWDPNSPDLQRLSATYMQQTLIVQIQPQAAINDGARWGISGSRDWLASGAPLHLAAGRASIVQFFPLGPDSPWLAPADMQVQALGAGETRRINAQYRRRAAITVRIGPDELRGRARWKFTTLPMAWKASGETAYVDPSQNLVVEFEPVNNWQPPPIIRLTTSEGQEANYTGQYTRSGPGQVRVSIDPPEAIRDGARWRIDNGPWTPSGTVLSIDRTGPGHIVEFEAVEGWQKPPNAILTVMAQEEAQTRGRYTALTGKVSVTIQPAEAAAAGAQWRIGGSPWQPSGAVLANVPAGRHAVELRGGGSWTPPPGVNASVLAGQVSRETVVFKKK